MMSSHWPTNNGSSPPPPHGWPAPPQPASGGKLSDLTKAGVPITIVGGMIYAVYMAIQMAFAAGQNVGAHQQTQATMQQDVRDLKQDVKSIKDELAALRPILKQLADRPAPQWSMAVRPTK